MELDGAVVIVTGGASGIGEATVRAVHDRGAIPVIIDMNEERGQALAAELDAAFVAADVADEAAVAQAVAVAEERGPVRALVNAAGIGGPARVIDREGQPMPMAHFEKIVRVNLLGTFNCLRLAAAAIARNDPLDEHGSRGAIVNITSVAAFDGQIGQVAYSSSKGGIVGMTLPAARDLSSVGIRVNTVAPGLVDTPIFGGREDLQARLAKGVLFPKRLAEASELADMIVVLLTHDYMNGEVVRVDGGIRMPPRS